MKSNNQGRIQDFKLGGALKINRDERREARNLFWYFVWKITILHTKNHIFSTRRPPPPGSAPDNCGYLDGVFFIQYSLKILWLILMTISVKCLVYFINVSRSANENLNLMTEFSRKNCKQISSYCILDNNYLFLVY